MQQLSKRGKQLWTVVLWASYESLYLPLGLFLSLSHDKLTELKSAERVIAIEFHLTAIWLKLLPL